MLQSISNEKIFIWFSIISLLICLSYCVLFHPKFVGDSYDYLSLAKEFLGYGHQDAHLLDRSPLYSVILSPFVAIFGDTDFKQPVLFFQYFLIFLTSLLIYKIMTQWNRYKGLPFVASMLYLLNYSTVYYGHWILSDTLGTFLFIVMIYLLIKYADNQKIGYLPIIALMNVLTSLARFNMLGVPLFTLACLVIIHLRKYRSDDYKKLLMHYLLYMVSVILFFSIWMSYNYFERGYFGIRPSSEFPKNAFAINENITKAQDVSTEFEFAYLTLVHVSDSLTMITRDRARNVSMKKSVRTIPFVANLYQMGSSGYVSGYNIYIKARPQLLAYYNIKEGYVGDRKLKRILDPLYNRLGLQFSKEIQSRKILALYKTFVTLLPSSLLNKETLDFIPSNCFVFIKIIPILLNLCVYLLIELYLLFNFWRIHKATDLYLMIFAIYLLYFPLANYYSSASVDAIRFKLASEPLLIGCLLYYFYSIFEKVKYKWRKKRISLNRARTYTYINS